MAKALQCPACGNKHPLAGLPNAATFQCERCGRTLKVPAQFRPRPAGPEQANGPRSGTATMPASGRRTAVAPPPPVPESAPPPRKRVDGARPRKVLWPFRVLVWLIALPLGLLIVVVPARRLGFLSGQRLLDVVVGTGWSRYWRVLAIAPAWALVTTLLVQLMLFGLRKLADRRKAIRAERDGRAEPEPELEPAAPSGEGRARGRRGRRRP